MVFQISPSPGSDLTVRLAKRSGKPFLCLDPWASDAMTQLRDFLRTHRPNTLNVAGHRESKAPGIGRQVYRVLTQVFSEERHDVPE